MVAGLVALHRRNAWRRVADEPDWQTPQSFPPNHGNRTTFEGCLVHTWADSIVQEVYVGENDQVNEVDVGLEVHVAVECPREAVDRRLEPLVARWTAGATHHRGYLWLSGPDTSLNGPVSKALRRRAVAITLGRMRPYASAIPALARLSRGGAGADAILSALVDTHGDHIAVRKRAAERIHEGTGRIRLDCAELLDDVAAMRGFAANPRESDEVRRAAFQQVRARHPNDIAPLAEQCVQGAGNALLALVAPHLRSSAIGALENIVTTADAHRLAIAGPALLRLDAEVGTAALVHCLDDRNDAIRLVAINALGTGGELSAVEPLDTLAGKLLTSSEMEAAARDAIQRIQHRAEGAGGSLTLVDEAGGTGDLSLADGGEVSLADSGDD